MQLALVFCCLILLVLGCKEPKPLEQYEDEELITLVMDIQLASTAVSNSTKSLQDSLKETYRAQVSKIHKVSYEEMDTIIKYIHLDLPRFNIIIDSVYARINRLIKDDSYGKNKKTKDKRVTK